MTHWLVFVWHLSVLDYFFNIWPQAITFSWEQKSIFRIYFPAHFIWTCIYIFVCIVYVFESCTFFCWCWFECFAYKVNFSSLCNGELKDWLCFVSKLSLFLPSFVDKTASFSSVQTFTLASGLQENWVSLCDFTLKIFCFVLVKYTKCEFKCTNVSLTYTVLHVYVSPKHLFIN